MKKPFVVLRRTKLPSFKEARFTPDHQRHPVRLPDEVIVIDGVTHVQHWRSDTAIVLQNYSKSGRESRFHAYRINRIEHEHASEEVLGDRLGTFPFVHEAIDRAAKEE